MISFTLSRRGLLIHLAGAFISHQVKPTSPPREHRYEITSHQQLLCPSVCNKQPWKHAAADPAGDPSSVTVTGQLQDLVSDHEAPSQHELISSMLMPMPTVLWCVCRHSRLGWTAEPPPFGLASERFNQNDVSDEVQSVQKVQSE